jgi:hypothetical protein
LKALQALGLALVLIGGLVVLGVPGLRPVGYALVICGVGLVIFGMLQARRPRRPKRRAPYSWEDDEPSGPRELYTAEPGEVRLRERGGGAAPEFTSPAPGTIPAVRSQASGTPAEFALGPSAPQPSPPAQTASGLSEELPLESDPSMPPMAPPPPT